MKKFGMAVGFCFLLGNVVWAGPISFGIHGGLNMANQTGLPTAPPYETTDVSFGFLGGVFTEFGLDNSLSFQPELNFTMKGVQLNLNNIKVTGAAGPAIGSENGSDSISYNYLEIPLFVKLHTPSVSGFEASLAVAPEASILLSANNHYSIGGAVGNVSINGSTLELGAVADAGIALDHFLLDLRYDLGLTSVLNGGFGVENSVLSLLVGYQI